MSAVAGLILMLAAVTVGLSMCGAGASAQPHAVSHWSCSGSQPPGRQPDCARPGDPDDRETGGTLTTVHFHSAALRKRADYLVYLPAGYSAADPLPVFYMLHGMPGKPVAFTVNANAEVKLEQLIHQGRIKPMILVFPDGRIDGRSASDSEWANTPSGNFEDYVTDVVRDVDQRFATLPDRQDRAIAGLSAGAYGAINVGLHQNAMFGLIQVWSGYFLETHNGVFADADRAVMAYNSPLDYVRTMRRTLAALSAADLHLRRARRRGDVGDPGDGGGPEGGGRGRVLGGIRRRPQLEHVDASRRPDADHGQPRLPPPAALTAAALYVSLGMSAYYVFALQPAG